MQSTRSSNVGVRYLSLGLAAQNVLDTLVAFVTKNVDTELNDRLDEALESLRSFATPYPVGAAGDQTLRSFKSYEEVRTLEEVCTPATCDDIIRTLQALKNRQGTTEEQKENGLKAIEFFYKLENQALRNFDRRTEFQLSNL